MRSRLQTNYFIGTNCLHTKPRRRNKVTIILLILTFNIIITIDLPHTLSQLGITVFFILTCHTKPRRRCISHDSININTDYKQLSVTFGSNKEAFVLTDTQVIQWRILTFGYTKVFHEDITFGLTLKKYATKIPVISNWNKFENDI